MIDEKKLIEDLIPILQCLDNPFIVGRIIGLIDSQPKLDVPDTNVGKWIHLGGDEWCCSECGLVVSTEGSWEHPSERGYEHCYKCGVEMMSEPYEGK